MAKLSGIYCGSCSQYVHYVLSNLIDDCSVFRPEDDFSIERMLALNFSYNVFIISDRITRPLLQLSNNTYVIATTVTANDPADFSRNSYGQRTINDVMKSLHHDRLDLLRFEGSGSAMWEVLHHMINDNLLMHVKQLHVTMRIGTCAVCALYSLA